MNKYSTRIVMCLGVASLMMLGHLFLRGLDWNSWGNIHLTMEALATLSAMSVGVLALVRFYSKPNNTSLIIGAGLIGTSLLDGFHAIVTSPFFVTLNSSPPPHLIPWSWTASRIFLSVIMFLSWWSWRIENKTGSQDVYSPIKVFTYIGLLTTSTFLFFIYVPLPRAYYPEYMFGRPEEFISGFFFLLALIGYLKKGQWKSNNFEYAIILMLIINLLNQCLFMAFSQDLHDAFFDASHVLKIVGYLVLQAGLFANMYNLFVQVEVQTVELKRSNEDLERFVYITSHDLKSPLRHIISYSQLLEKPLKDHPNTEVKDFIEVIQKSAKRMSCLVASILDFSKIKQGESCSVIYVDEVIREVIKNIQDDLDVNNAAIEIKGLQSSAVTANQTHLEMLFTNVIENAIKYRSENALRIRIKSVVTETTLILHFDDNGMGVEKQYREQIFEPFKRIEVSNIEGTGVGLATCKRIMDIYKGKISVTDNDENKGSRFTIEFPIHQTNPKELLK